MRRWTDAGCGRFLVGGLLVSGAEVIGSPAGTMALIGSPRIWAASGRRDRVSCLCELRRNHAPPNSASRIPEMRSAFFGIGKLGNPVNATPPRTDPSSASACVECFYLGLSFDGLKDAVIVTMIPVGMVQMALY